MNIFKYKLSHGTNRFLLPSGSRWLQPMVDPEGFICIWALQPVDKWTDTFELEVCFTGENHPLTSLDTYLGSLTHNNLVYHVFQLC